MLPWVQFWWRVRRFWEKSLLSPLVVVAHFYPVSSGPQAGGWFTKELNSLDDSRHQNAHSPDWAVEVMRPDWPWKHCLRRRVRFSPPCNRAQLMPRNGSALE